MIRFFSKFNLTLPQQTNETPNPLNKLNYDTLSEYKASFDFRPIRNVVIKQNFPDPEQDRDSSIYEIFNRLNSGGVTLTPQEIRASLYHSKFYDMLYRMNTDERWRKILGLSEPDLHLKDLEVLLRGCAMLKNGEQYRPSMTRFLNKFSKESRKFDEDQVNYYSMLIEGFFDATRNLEASDFFSKTNKRFNISLFEAVFCAACSKAFARTDLEVQEISREKMTTLRNDDKFIEAIQYKTASTFNVNLRLNRAAEILLGDM